MKPFEHGTVQVSNDVIDTLIASAASKVEGVREVKGYDERAGKLRMQHQRSIETEIKEGRLTSQLTIAVKEGEAILSVAENVQRAVKHEVENILGLHCEAVFVDVVA